MMTYAQYLEGNRKAMDESELRSGASPAENHGAILMLAMHRIGRIAYALTGWAAIHAHGGEHPELVEKAVRFRKEILDFAAHTTVLLERIARRVEADAPPMSDDAPELCEVTAQAHQCTERPGCPSCGAQRLLMLRQQAYEAKQTAKPAPDKDLN